MTLQQIKAEDEQRAVVLKKASIVGIIYMMRGDPKDQACVCCKPGTGHIFSRGVKFEDQRPYVNRINDLIDSVACRNTEFEGKRIRVTIEVLEDSPQSAAA